MKRALKVVALLLSHAALFGTTVALVWGYRTQAALQKAEADPLYRMGLRLHSREHDRVLQLRPLDADIQAVAKLVGPRAADVIRLSTFVHNSQLEEAAENCKRLEWPRCDETTLMTMHDGLPP